MVVEQRERRIEIYSRSDDGWAFTVVEPPDDEIVLAAIDARLSLEAIYEDSGR